MALRRNVLIFHSGALGDFVLSWPLALAFGRVFAQSRVFYVSAGQKGQLAEKALRIESTDAEAGWHGLFTEGGAPALPPTAERLLTGAHAIASFVSDGDDSAWARNVRAVAPDADVVSLAARPPAGYAGGHHVDHLVEQLATHVIWQQGVRQMVASVRQRGLGATPTAGGPVVIHPGSGSPDKCWPIDWFVELAVRLRAVGRAARFVVGDVEQERWPAAAIDRLSAAGEVVRPTTLVGLLAAYAGASAFVGNDSGPGHLAATHGLPTVSIFGKTDPAVWRPVGPRTAVVGGDGRPLKSIKVDEVLDATLRAG